MKLLSTSPKLQKKPLTSSADRRLGYSLGRKVRKKSQKISKVVRFTQCLRLIVLNCKAQPQRRRTWQSPHGASLLLFLCHTLSAVDGKQERLSVLSQGFLLVPHYPGPMRSRESLPDPQSLPETADCRFLQGQFPLHRPLRP